MKYDIIIGLEFHVQLKTKTKMYCGCLNESLKAAPNTNICPICLGHPGVLPAVNAEAIRMAMKAGLALNCTINKESKFDRKNYFYPDLPKGYQISQYDVPIAEYGSMVINALAADGLAGRLDDEAQLKRISIRRLHMEEDAAKNIHDGSATLVDYNRGGAPLVEIVTGPDFSSAHEAKTFAQELQLLMRYLDVSTADMEKGQLRCDANISLRPHGENKLYPKTEVKNINSFRAIERALEFEIDRQYKLWEDGKPPMVTVTRGWDDTTQTTVGQRTKESEADYRYFPEPDIPPMIFTAEEIAETKQLLPELPQDKRRRFMAEYELSPDDAKLLTVDPSIADYTEQVISELKEWVTQLDSVEGTADEIWAQNGKKLTKITGSWLVNNLLALLTKRDIPFSELKITPENFAEFITVVYENKVNSTNAQKLLSLMIDTGADPSHVIEEHQLAQVDNADAIDAIIKQVIAANPDQVAQYKGGKLTVIKYLLGQVMRESKGSVNPQIAEELLQKALQ